MFGQEPHLLTTFQLLQRCGGGGGQARGFLSAELWQQDRTFLIHTKNSPDKSREVSPLLRFQPGLQISRNPMQAHVQM